MERSVEVRKAIFALLRSLGAKPGMTVSICAVGIFLIPSGFGHGELTEALLSLLRGEVMGSAPGTNSLMLLEAL